MPNIELTYASLDNYIAKLNAIDGNYSAAISALNDATDLGSDFIQACWSFTSKDKAYNGLDSVKKKIKRVSEENRNLKRYLVTIPGIYNQTANKQKDCNAKWAKTIGIIGRFFYPMPFTGIFIAVAEIWGATRIISYFTDKSKKKPDIPATKPIASSIGITPTTIKESPSEVPKTEPKAENTSVTGLTNEQFAALKAQLDKYMNSPYVKRGASISGVDCSGLVMRVFADAGIRGDLYHGTVNMYKQCTPVGTYPKGQVDLSALRKGDLVFYGSDTPESIGHVGVYMGDGQVMSALNPSDGVQIKDIDYTYKTTIYVARV